MRKNETHTEIVEQVSLTPEDAAAYRRLSRFDYQFDHRLSSLILDLLEERAVRQDEMWDEVAKHTSYGSMDKLGEADRRLSVNWATRKVTVYKRPEVEAKKPCSEPSK